MTTTPRHTSDRSSVRNLLTELRDDLRERREARAAHRTLARELASYRTPAEVDDLLAAVRQQNGAGSDEIRAILSHNLMAHSRLAS